MSRVKRDPFTSYRNAAEKGIADAQYQLGLIYSSGQGVAVNLVEAHKWFNLAALRGLAAARDHRAALAEEMSNIEVSEAQRQARKWQFAH